MKRTLAFSFAAVLAVLLAALAGAVAFRATLVEGGLEWWLDRQGFADADIEVRDVSLRRLDLGPTRLGGDGAPMAESVEITYAPLELMRGRVRAVDVSGLRARARIAPDGIGLAGLPGGFAGTGEGGLIPGAVTLGDARIDLETPVGDAVARLDGTLAWQGAQIAGGDLALVIETANGRLQGPLSVGRAGLDGIDVAYLIEDGVLSLAGAQAAKLAGRASLRLRDGAVAGAALDLRVPETGVSGRRSGIALALEGAYAPGRARLAATFTEEDGRGEARAVLDVAEPLGRRRLAAEADGSVSARSVLWALAGVPAPSAGRVRMAATARGDAGLDWMRGEARLEVEGLAHASVGDDIAGAARADFSLADGVLTATLAEPASLSGTLARSLPATAGAPPWLADALRGTLALRLEGAGDAPFRVTVAPAAGGHRIEVAGRVAANLGAGESAAAGTLAIAPTGLSAAADVEVALPRLAGLALVAEGVAVRVPLALAIDGATATLRLTGPGRLGADRVALGDAAALARPLAWTLVAGEAPLARLEGARLTYALFLRDGANELAIPASKSPGTGADAGTRLTLAAAALDVRGETGGGRNGAEATFRAVLGHAQRPAWFVPVRVAGSLRLAGETLSFDATAEDDGGATRARAQGTLAGGRAIVDVRLGPFAFAPAGLQPAALFPALAALGNVSGDAAAELEYRQAAGKAREGGVIHLQGLSFESGGIGVRDLDAEVRLDGLFPPSTPPGQTLSIARIDAVSTLEEVRASFQIEARPRPRLRLATARAGFAGGEMRIDDVVLAAGSPPPSLTVGIKSVKIEPLLEVIGLESVRATGELSGEIPIRFVGGEAIAIEDGRLAADGAGVLQVRSPEIAAALAAGGQSAELMGRVLEDFHYDALSIEVAKSAEGEARVLLHLSGNNPAVLDGYPFVFNINVASNVDEIVKALLRGYRLTADALRRAAERDGKER